MKNFWSQVKGWFKDAEQSSASKPFVKEWLERSEDEKKDLELWKLSESCLELTSLVASGYNDFKEDNSKFIPKRLTFLSSAKAAGFVLYFPKGKSELREAQRFMDFLKWKVGNLNYISQLSDYRMYVKNGNSERIERFYLKPRLLLNAQNQVDQKFGNILIELTIRDEKPVQLKLQSNRYSDRNYVDADSFQDLMDRIFM